MARTTVPEIHCCELSVDDLHIYLASTEKGALRVELSLEKRYDSIGVFRRLFPSARLTEDYRFNRPLIKGVEAELLKRETDVATDFDF